MHMVQIFYALIALVVSVTQPAFATASSSLRAGNDAIILSPKVFVFNENTQAEIVAVLPTDVTDVVIASLSWTDNTGNRRAEIEIVNIIYNEDINSVFFETKQWLPYTLSGEVVSLPILLKNATLKFL